jgi:bifunctional non-homologous end joining protein LigD
MIDGGDLRRLPLEERRDRLRRALRGSRTALRFSEHLDGDGTEKFRHACAVGLEGIVSKRRDLPYRSGRCAAWLKIRNPDYERL